MCVSELLIHWSMQTFLPQSSVKISQSKAAKMKQVNLSPVQMNFRLQEIKKKKPNNQKTHPTITVEGMKSVFYS